MLKLFVKCTYLYFSILFERKDKKSILIIPDFVRYGGTRTYFMTLVKFLVNKRWNVTVMLRPEQLDQEIEKLQAEYFFKIELHQFDVWRTRFQRPVFSKLNKTYLLYQMREMVYFFTIFKKKRASQIVCSVANPEELLFLFLSPINLLYVLHTATTDRMDKFKRSLLNARLNASRRIVTVSNFAKDLVLANWTAGKNARHIHVVHNCYEPALHFQKNKQLSLPAILTVGTITGYKNPFFWIDVCKQVLARYQKPLRFIWAGDGPLFSRCRTIAADVPEIQFIGFHSNVEELYAKCSIYYQPSIHETHGISVLGAMYYQKPCVVSNRGGLPESVVDSDCGYVVDIDDTTPSVDALVHILNDQVLAKQMGINARERFDAVFTRQQWENKMTDILNQ